MASPALKINTPEPFDGKRSQLSAFLTQLSIYIKMNPAAFPDEETKVFFASSYLRGAAYDWFEGRLKDRLDNDGDEDEQNETTTRVFEKFDTFKKQIQQTFGEVDAERTAERNLQNLRQSGSASSYAADFQRWAARTEWDDSAQVAQYYKGLKDRIKDELVRDDWPEDLESIIEKTIKIDNRLHERDMERKGSYRQFISNGKKHHQPQRSNRNYYGPQPMEIDNVQKHRGLNPAEREHRMKNKLCLYCGKPGHQAKQCRAKKNQGQKPPPRQQPKRQFGRRQANNVVHQVNTFEPIAAEEWIIEFNQKNEEGYLTAQEDTSSISSFELVPSQDATSEDSLTEPTLPSATPEQLQQIQSTYERETEKIEKKAIPQELTITATDRHALNHWTACFDDYCPAHYQAKLYGWTPKKPQWKTKCDATFWTTCYNDDCSRHLLQKVQYRWYPQEPQRLCEENQWNTCYNHQCEEHFYDKHMRQYFPGLAWTREEQQKNFEGQSYHQCSQELWQLCFAPACFSHLAAKKSAGYMPKNF
jgi:hypothetical protein